MKKFALTLAVLMVATSIPATGMCQQSPGLSITTSQTDNYNPDTPWSNGKVFKMWIGHGGKFYNCDCEEDKRFSPYIQWKSVTHCEKFRGPVSAFYPDIQEVKARVRAGKCLEPCWPKNQCPECCDNGSGSCSTCDLPGTRPLPGFQPGQTYSGYSSRRPAMEPLPIVKAGAVRPAPTVQPTMNSAASGTAGILSVRPLPNLKH